MNERLVSRRDFLKVTGTGLAGATLLGIAGCGGSSGGQEGNSEFELTLGHFMPEQHTMHRELMEPLADQLAERSNGRIQVNIYPGGALGGPDQQYQAAVNGAMDIAYGLPEYTPGRFPLTSAMQLPFLFESAEQATRSFWELYETVPEFAAEYDDVKILTLLTTDSGVPSTVDQPIEDREDLRGLTIRSPGPITNRLLEALGSTPVNTPISEAYDALERGVVDGLVTPYSAMQSFGLYEVLGHTAPVPFYVSAAFLVMNRQTWEDLSDSDQELIDEIVGEELSLRSARAYEADGEAGLKQLEESGIELHELPETELARWEEAGNQVVDGWIEEREAEGLPGSKVYETILEANGQG